MKCSRCGREITKEEGHPYQGKVLCDDCYMDVMSSQEKTCDPWATYLSSRDTKGPAQKGVAALTESERAIYEFIKSKGRATRKQVMTKFKLSEQDLGPQLHVLMHAEMIKEISESGQMYLHPIPIDKEIGKLT